MSDEEFNPMDFSNIPGAINPADLPSAPAQTSNGMPNFASAPGSISAESLVLPEVNEIRPITVAPKLPTGAYVPTTGASGFDNDGVMSFLNNYGVNKKSRSPKAVTQESVSADSITSMSKDQQIQFLNSLLMTNNSNDEEYDDYELDDDEEYEDDEDFEFDDDDDDEDFELDEDDEEYEDDDNYGSASGCKCTLSCPNTDCIFYGKDNYVSIEELIEDKLDSIINELIESGELDRRQPVKKASTNKYLKDMSQYL